MIEGIHTEVRRHPRRGGWAVFVLVTTDLGNVLYASHEDWILRESAEVWQRDVLDPRLGEVLRGPRLGLESRLEALDLLARLPSPYRAEQFDAA